MRIVQPTAVALRSVLSSLCATTKRSLRPAPLQQLSSTYSTYGHQQQHHQHWRHGRSSFAAMGLAVAVAGVASGLSAAALCEANASSEEEKQPPLTPGEVDPALPTYTLEQVQEHTGAKKNGVWVVYKHGVYEITRFIASHPGGTKILLAAGKSIEPFWQLYAAHNHEDVHRILESLRIGNLCEEDVLVLDKIRKERYGDGPYSHDPTRHPALKVNSSMPFNAEPPPELLMESFITPNDLFFVRNHLPVPNVSIDDYKLKVAGIGIGKDKEVSFTLDELKAKFKHHTVATTIQCAGNRRAEMSGVKQVNGLSWDTTALSTANWTGVLLSDVLASLGVSEEDCRPMHDCDVAENIGTCDDCNCIIQHVQFEGLDVDTEGKSYGASIPFSTAVDPRKDVLLAFEMNGEPIPRDHGYPLRVIVPGTVGARNVKFVHRIVLSNVESPSFWQQRDYRGFPPNVDYSREDYWKFAGESIQELPVQSAITEPKNGSVHTVEDGSDSSVVTVKGYAWSGGGRNIIRVDVSADGGKTWNPAVLNESGRRQKYNRAWAWTPWEIDVEVPPGTKNLDITCKAVDSSYNVQPDTIAPIWNMRGVLNNAWHKVGVEVVVEASDDEEEEADEEEEDNRTPSLSIAHGELNGLLGYISIHHILTTISMDDIFDDALAPDENGILDLQDKHWVTLDEVVWTHVHSMLVLNVSRNQLVHLPSDVGNLLLLRELLLSNNRISALPKQIGNCIQLRKLDLHRNRLTEIPGELQYCERLEELDVSYNELVTLPAELGRLQCLRVLNVRHNKLTSLPHTLCECPRLEELGCEDNAGLEDIPESLRGNTKLVLWICATMKKHRAQVAELVDINTELERMAPLGDEERLKLREEIARLQREKAALEAERPHHYLFVKKHVLRATSQVCALM